MVCNCRSEVKISPLWERAVLLINGPNGDNIVARNGNAAVRNVMVATEGVNSNNNAICQPVHICENHQV